MADILILHSSIDGHTITICERLKRVIAEDGHRVTLARVDDTLALDPSAFDKVVIGASIRYGKHRPQVLEFIDRHRELLETLPSAFFSVNIVARKAGKDSPQTNPYLRKFLCRSAWRPREVAVFAGRLDYPKYGFLDRLMIRLIMKITGGPTDPETVIEYTDWPAVDAFARRVCAL